VLQNRSYAMQLLFLQIACYLTVVINIVIMLGHMFSMQKNYVEG